MEGVQISLFHNHAILKSLIIGSYISEFQPRDGVLESLHAVSGVFKKKYGGFSVGKTVVVLGKSAVVLREGILPLCSTLMKPHLEHSAWGSPA